MNEKKTQISSTPSPRRWAVPHLSGFLSCFSSEKSASADGDGVRGRRSFLRAFIQCGALLLLCALLAGGAVLTASLAMVHSTREMITTVAALEGGALSEDYDCILVLGAGVRADGSPSEMLRDRVTVACTLHDALGDPALPMLMSGDHTGDYNEVGVMKKLATEMGISSQRIFLDHEGYSTYESLYRARYVFGARKIIIVTQEYHLHRALHIARELGIEAVGVASDLRPYRKQTTYEARETLARFKDMFVAAKGDYKGHPDPFVDLEGDGDLTN